jgi:hypothetical protein
MKGIIATAHFDSKRNFIAMIRGRKRYNHNIFHYIVCCTVSLFPRYILLPPEECGKLELYPRGHPSARHSSVPWHDIDQVNTMIL